MCNRLECETPSTAAETTTTTTTTSGQLTELNSEFVRVDRQAATPGQATAAASPMRSHDKRAAKLDHTGCASTDRLRYVTPTGPQRWSSRTRGTRISITWTQRTTTNVADSTSIAHCNADTCNAHCAAFYDLL